MIHIIVFLALISATVILYACLCAGSDADDEMEEYWKHFK